MQVWLYEACRLFRDKLAEEEDLAKFDQVVLTCLQNDWNQNFADYMSKSSTYYVTAGVAMVSCDAEGVKHGLGRSRSDTLIMHPFIV